MIVKCINDNYSDSKSPIVQAILTVGDNDCLPKKDGLYEVVGYYDYKDPETKEQKTAYILEGEGLENSINYGAKLVFPSEKFIVHDDTFVPNFVTEDGSLVRKVVMTGEFLKIKDKNDE